jgi:hypothetical protein
MGQGAVFLVKFRAFSAEKLLRRYGMDVNATSGSPEALAVQVGVSVQKKTMDLAQQQALALIAALPSSANPNIGKQLDVTG